MEDIPAPFTVLNDFPFPPSRVSAVQERRFGQTLLYDRLLELAHVDQSLYPPQDVLGLRTLISSTQSSPFDSLRRHCLLLYLLFFYADDRAIQYASRLALPSNFLHSTRAYWFIDNGYYAEGVDALAKASLDGAIDFLPAIISTLPTPERIRLVRFVKPSMTEISTILLFVTALVNSNRVADAWAYGHKLSTNKATLVWNKIIDMVFEETNIKNSTSLRTLLSLPLSTKREQDVLMNACACADRPSSNDTDIRIEFLISRFILCGSHLEALRILSNPATPPPSDPKAHVRRHTTINALKSVLYDVERQQFELDIEPPSNMSIGANEFDDITKDYAMIESDEINEPTSTATSTPPVVSASSKKTSTASAMDESNKKKKNKEYPSLPLSGSPFFRNAPTLAAAQDASASKTKTLLGAVNRVSNQRKPSLVTTTSKSGSSSPFRQGSPYRTGVPTTTVSSHSSPLQSSQPQRPKQSVRKRNIEVQIPQPSPLGHERRSLTPQTRQDVEDEENPNVPLINLSSTSFGTRANRPDSSIVATPSPSSREVYASTADIIPEGMSVVGSAVGNRQDQRSKLSSTNLRKQQQQQEKEEEREERKGNEDDPTRLSPTYTRTRSSRNLRSSRSARSGLHDGGGEGGEGSQRRRNDRTPTQEKELPGHFVAESTTSTSLAPTSPGITVPQREKESLAAGTPGNRSERRSKKAKRTPKPFSKKVNENEMHDEVVLEDEVTEPAAAGGHDEEDELQGQEMSQTSSPVVPSRRKGLGSGSTNMTSTPVRRSARLSTMADHQDRSAQK